MTFPLLRICKVQTIACLDTVIAHVFVVFTFSAITDDTAASATFQLINPRPEGESVGLAHPAGDYRAGLVPRIGNADDRQTHVFLVRRFDSVVHVPVRLSAAEIRRAACEVPPGCVGLRLRYGPRRRERLSSVIRVTEESVITLFARYCNLVSCDGHNPYFLVISQTNVVFVFTSAASTVIGLPVFMFEVVPFQFCGLPSLSNFANA